MHHETAQSSSVSIESLESRTFLSATPQVVGYLPDYRYDSTLMSNLDWSTLSQVNYFSVRPNSNGTMPSQSSSGYALTGSNSQVDKVVQAAHGHSKKAYVVIGGAGLDDTLTTIINGGQSAWTNFATNLKNFVSAHSLDGVDLDWEPVSSSTSQINNYGSLIKTIQSNTSFGLSAAVNAEKIDIGGGSTSYVLNSDGVANLDAINVMAYDLRPGSQFSPVGQTETDLQNWGSYVQSKGGSKTKINFLEPFYGRNSNDDAELYSTIYNDYLTAHGGSTPAVNADTLMVGATTWYINSPTTIYNKTKFALTNGYGGVGAWELGQDLFPSGGGYSQTHSLFPQIKKAITDVNGGGGAGGGSISGTVYNDLNGNGAKNTGENGISGITIYNDANNNNKIDSGEKTTTTDSNGVYKLTGLSAGNYKIREVLQAGWSQTTPANNYGWTITLATNQNLSGKDFGTKQNVASNTGSISGTIFNDANGSGSKNSGENGVGAGWTVYIDLDNDSKLDSNEVFTTTDQYGNWKLSNLAAGTYKIRQVLMSGWIQTTPSNNYGLNVTLTTGQQVSGKLFGSKKTS